MQYAPLDSNAQDFFKSNRSSLQKKLKDSFLLLFGNSTLIRNNDVEYAFRQDSDFYYLTGCSEPDAILLIDGKSETIYLPELTDHEKIWTGRILEPGNSKKTLGLGAKPLADFDEDLKAALSKHSTVLFPFRSLEDRGEPLFEAISSFKANARRGGYAFSNLQDSDPIVHELRITKREFEVLEMLKALKATRTGFMHIMGAQLLDRNEADVSTAIESYFRRGGATDLAYPSIVAGGNNANVLHYVANNQRLRDGDLILIDAGAESNYYASDITRTFPVGSKFTQAQRELYELVLSAQKKACAEVRPGNTMGRIHQNVVRRLTQGLTNLGILKGDWKENVKEKKYAKYFMHSTGHWLGLDVHDQGRYYTRNQNGGFSFRDLKAGMITTIEPGLYIPAGDKHVPAQYRGIGIRIEDNVLVTRGGQRILSQSIPKEVAEIEELRAKQLPL